MSQIKKLLEDLKQAVSEADDLPAAFALIKRKVEDGFNGAADNLDNGMGDQASRRLVEVSAQLMRLADAAKASGDERTAQEAKAIADEAQSLAAELRGARPKELDVAGDHVYELRMRSRALANRRPALKEELRTRAI